MANNNSIDLDRFVDEDDDEFNDEFDNELDHRQVGNLSEEDVGDDEESDMASMPTELKALRACMVCTLVKTYGQFIDEGCDNCESFLKMADRQDRVAEFTSHTFEGMAAVMSPTDSWVAKYQGIHMLKPGIYCLEVTGNLSQKNEEYLQQMNVPFRAKRPQAI